MINGTFYPTPPEVIDRMVQGMSQRVDIPEGEVEIRGRMVHRNASTRWIVPGNDILEPSAGKGDIVDRLVEKYRKQASAISCIETDEDLRATLTGKYYKVIDTDFLNFGDPFHFDLIVMNPPFSAGAKHLLKAWHTIADGGHIACLLNAETIRNPNTTERQVLAGVIEAHGRTEEIGSCFKTAERPTDVECVIVWLQKPEREKVVDFDDVEFEQDQVEADTEYAPNPLASRNAIKSLVDQYQAALQLLQDRRELNKKIGFYTRSIRYYVEESRARDFEEQVNDLKKGFWGYVFEKTQIGQTTTSQFRQDFDKQVETTSRLSFSEANVLAVLDKFFLDRDRIVQQCIVESFDKATSYHEKNSIHPEGWKTNQPHKLNKTVIHPRGIETPSTGFSWSVRYGRERDFYDDLDKALCFVQGKPLEDIVMASQAMSDMCSRINNGDMAYDEKFESTHFAIRMYKKGTVHLTFKDLDLLARFNFAAAQGKNWVGPGKYEDHHSTQVEMPDDGDTASSPSQLVLFQEQPA